jgi:predicted transcriptional regulator
VSRDGSLSYASAISKGLPEAIQISDRFHLLKGLCDAANKCFQRIFQGRVPIPLTSESEQRRQILRLGTKAEKAELLKTLRSEGRTIREIQSITGMTGEKVKKYLNQDKPQAAKKNCTVRGKEHEAAVKKVQERADLVRRLRDAGNNLSEISRNTGFTYATVKRYLSDNFSPVNGHYGRKREGKLYQFRDDVLDMRAQGKTYAQIYESIRSRGYTGTQDAIRGWVTKEQRVVSDFQDRFGHTEFIEKKWVVRLLYKPLRDIPAMSREQFAAVLRLYPLAKEIFKFTFRFKGIMKMRDTNRLPQDTAVRQCCQVKGNVV